MAKYVIDTHALLWFLTASPRLGSSAKAALEDPGSELFLPAIALAEALWIVDKLQGALKAKDLVAAIDSDARISIAPLTREAVERGHSLSAISEMHDRQIAATALILSEAGDPVVLLTMDADVVASQVVPTIW